MKNGKDILVSIVIPCYNHGKYIDDALISLKNIKDIEYEIIIINDGSTDSETLKKLDFLSEQGFNVINKTNEGLGKARNYGIALSRGKYILPLDSDNKIKPEYLYSALSILEKNEADIVYAKPSFFGDNLDNRIFSTQDFDIFKLLGSNYIDACAIYRKSVWEINNGYETNMPYQGHEDWEFWINSYVNGFKFKFIDEELYYYRILSNSMISNTNKLDRGIENFKYILNKHHKLYRSKLKELNSYRLRINSENSHPLRASIKYLLIFLGIRS
jgi:glycosyltransferase involved in cell wall biosynthesis